MMLLPGFVLRCSQPWAKHHNIQVVEVEVSWRMFIPPPVCYSQYYLIECPTKAEVSGEGAWELSWSESNVLTCWQTTHQPRFSGPWGLTERKKEVKGLSFCLHCERAVHQLSFVGDFPEKHSCKGLYRMSVFTGDKPDNTLTHSKCNSHIYNVGPTDQRAASHGSKRPLVLTTKPLSDIRGQRSSFLLFPIPLLSLTVFLPRDISPTPSAVNTVGCRHLWLGGRLSGKHRATYQTPAFEHALQFGIRMPETFHSESKSFQRGKAGAWGEQRARSPTAPSWHRFSGCKYLPGILLLSIHLSSSITYVEVPPILISLWELYL